MQAIWKSIYIVLYSFLSVGNQCEPGNSLLKHDMKEKWLSLHHAFNFNFVSELYCNNSWQINFVALKVTLTSFQSISKVSQM